MTNDSLKRDDMARTVLYASSDLNRFTDYPADMQKALARAASRGAANLPRELPAGWLMVPTKRGAKQVIVSGSRAFC